MFSSRRAPFWYFCRSTRPSRRGLSSPAVKLVCIWDARAIYSLARIHRSAMTASGGVPSCESTPRASRSFIS